MLTGREKYIATQALGEGVIFVDANSRFRAATVIRCHSETLVDLKLVEDGSVHTSVEYSSMLDAPYRWGRRPTGR